LPDPYYSRPEVSNSTLSWIKAHFEPPAYAINLQQAYKEGTLVDCLITEPHKVDFYQKRIDEYIYTEEEMARGKEMRDAFWRHPFCADLAKKSMMQKISVRAGFDIKHGSFLFHLDARCKWDLFIKHFDMGGDIKTTSCTSLKQFQQTIFDLDYDRQGAWYLDIENRNNFVFIGISKKPPHEIFIITMNRGDKLYYKGKEKYQELAFKHHCLL
jgi:hypothetical protein